MKTRLALALLLIVTACGGEDAATTTEAAPTTGDASTETTVAAPTTTTAAPTTTMAETTTTAPASPVGADCVAGSWELDSAAFIASLEEAFAAETGDVPAEITFAGGSYIVDLGADGSMAAVRDAWQFRFETSEGAIVNTIDGTDSGTWSVEGDTMTVTSTNSTTTVSIQAEVDGELIDLPIGSAPQAIDQDEFSGSGSFDCSDDTLTVTLDGFTSVFDRR